MVPFEFQKGVGVFKWNQVEFQMESKEILILKDKWNSIGGTPKKNSKLLSLLTPQKKDNLIISSQRYVDGNEIYTKEIKKVKKENREQYVLDQKNNRDNNLIQLKGLNLKKAEYIKTEMAKNPVAISFSGEIIITMKEQAKDNGVIIGK